MTDEIPPTVQTPTPGGSANLIARVQDILLKPAPTWDVIDAEPATVKSLYQSYIMPLAAIGPIANAIGGVVFGYGIFGLSVRPSLVSVLTSAIVSYILSLALIYVVALVINALAPSFDGQKDMVKALKVAAYGSTAAWVAAILGILPSLAAIGALLGLYGLYLIYLGLPKLMKNPPEKTIIYMIVTAVAYFILSLILAAIISALSGAAMVGGNMMTGGALNGIAAKNDRVSGSISIPGAGSVDLDKLQAASDQMAAQASAMEKGNSTVKLADPVALLSLMPPSFNGAARSDENTQSNAAGGMAVSGAEGTYKIGDGTVRLKVTDLGTMAGLGAMASAFNVNSSSMSAGGYEKVSSKDGIMTTEKWDSGSKHGEYAVVANGRINVEADGDGVDMATLKAIVASVDMGRAKALAN